MKTKEFKRLESSKYIKNSNEIPYICRYDYKLMDLSNSILLESNIDTDIFDDISFTYDVRIL